mmetsp:Transcript_19335/g.32494  ORF Transcript_19335/g.32494 Transcript_19335/m.32494 type:complete len:273 (+) Transcript_19335:209-1027(+)
MEHNAEPSTADAEIARLLECRNLAGGGWHWKVLSLDRSTASPEDVKRQYRRTALQVHPDKTEAAFASEAFIVLSDALHRAFAEASNKDQAAAPHHHSWPCSASTPSSAETKQHRQTDEASDRSDPFWKPVDAYKSYEEVLADLKAFEEAFVNELKAGAEERLAVKRRREERKAALAAAEDERRREDQEIWLADSGVENALDGARSSWASFKKGTRITKSSKKVNEMPISAHQPKASSRTSSSSKRAVPKPHSVYGLLSEHSRLAEASSTPNK